MTDFFDDSRKIVSRFTDGTTDKNDVLKERPFERIRLGPKAGPDLLTETHDGRGHPEALAMTKRLLSRSYLALILCVIGSFASDLEASPIRSAPHQRVRNQKQQTWTRIRAQANRRLMQQGFSSPTGLRGLRGASFRNLAAQSIDDGTFDTTAAMTLQDVWNSLSGQMRYANRLRPDPNTGLLPDTPFVADLLQRRLINQSRFDSNHPVIAQYLDWQETIRNNGGPSVLNPAVRPPTPTNPTSPQVIIPEPSSVLIAMGLIGFVAWRSRGESRS